MTDLKNGQIGMLDGCPVFESANLSGKEFILGNNTYCHFVNAWAVPVSVNNLSDDDFEAWYGVSRWELVFNRKHSKY